MATANLATANTKRKGQHISTQDEAAQDARIGAIIDDAFGKLFAAMVACDRAGHHGTVKRLDRAMREIAKVRGISTPEPEKQSAPKKRPRHLHVVRDDSEGK